MSHAVYLKPKSICKLELVMIFQFHPTCEAQTSTQARKISYSCRSFIPLVYFTQIDAHTSILIDISYLPTLGHTKEDQITPSISHHQFMWS